LERNAREELPRGGKITGNVQSHVIQLACSKPPAGRARWTLRLMAEHLVEIEVIDAISQLQENNGLGNSSRSRYRLPAVMKRTFTNPWPHEVHQVVDILRWKMKLGPAELPILPDAPQTPAVCLPLVPAHIAEPPDAGWRVTWLGHASFLLQGAGASILVDPVFSDYCAPLPLPGLKRKVPAPCKIADLPGIDAVLLTHGHYDHLDLPTLREIGIHTPVWIAEGHAPWLTRQGFTKVRELAWHSSAEISPGVKATSTPAQHFTARSLMDRNRGHWCGWLLEGAGCKIWHAGDSGYCPAFLDIGERYGPLDLGMIPIGAYQPRRIMRAMHINPAEAVQAFKDTRCRQAVAMHWGTFQLTDEPMGEPPLLLARALNDECFENDRFVAAAIGHSLLIQASAAPV
jgi:N-acyl-phosphatidylethanolamine-hydrolysing phospholipase D